MEKSILISQSDERPLRITPTPLWLLASQENQKIGVENYLDFVGPFGHFFSRHSSYHTFNIFPKPFISYAGIFISLFINQIIQTNDDQILITALRHSKHISFTGLKTPFGRLDLDVQPTDSSLNINIHHEFHASPKEITLIAPHKFNYYSFENDQERGRIENHCIKIPLNKKCIHLFE